LVSKLQQLEVAALLCHQRLLAGQLLGANILWLACCTGSG